jgi:hypothetical protein
MLASCRCTLKSEHEKSMLSPDTNGGIGNRQTLAAIWEFKLNFGRCAMVGLASSPTALTGDGRLPPRLVPRRPATGWATQARLRPRHRRPSRRLSRPSLRGGRGSQPTLAAARSPGPAAPCATAARQWRVVGDNEKTMPRSEFYDTRSTDQGARRRPWRGCQTVPLTNPGSGGPGACRGRVLADSVGGDIGMARQPAGARPTT